LDSKTLSRKRRGRISVDASWAQLEQNIPVATLLGYLNFSDGRPDPRWQKQVNDAYAWLADHGETQPWQALLDGLTSALERLQGGSAAFRDIGQAREVLRGAAAVLPAYRRFHADLLAHLTDAELFGPFFLVRVCEAVLTHRSRGGATAAEEIATAVVTQLNDFIGHRPIAVLETRPLGEPYPHERHRPLPLYLRGAGVAWGPYRDLITGALDILKATDPALLSEAQFDLQLLDELAVDLRAFDHGHPVNRRPNYVFGEWDPTHLDNQGRFRRYVARRITLDALLDRVVQPEPGTRAERLQEAAGVLAGTILMAAGVSGWGPAAHDSATSLAVLLPRIARYRDAFYQQLLPRLAPEHADRLRQEQELTRQPFGSARQHLNAYLARHRAAQLQQRFLSMLYAEMGFAAASRAEAARIPSVGGRLLSEILVRLTQGPLEIQRGRLTEAAQLLPEAEDLLQRGIACGAFADPWNILGFQGLFPLSAAREDSVRDGRLDELLQVIDQQFNLYARLISESAAAGDGALMARLQGDLDRLAAWWDRFATVDVSEMRRVHGGEAARSIAQVAEALTRWHERGETPADLAFWRGHLENFRSPKAFALVIDTLLRKGDWRAALALLINWVGQAEQVPLDDGVYSFHALALRWMLALTQPAESGDVAPPALPLPQRRELVVKFFDYLEANAEEYWQAPALDNVEQLGMPQEEEGDLFEAAYEGVTFEDSTDDDQESALDEGPRLPQFDLEHEAPRLDRRLRFLAALARLWQVAGRFLAADRVSEQPRAGVSRERQRSTLETLRAWLRTAREREQQLLALLDAIHARPVPEPSGDYESLVEFDRHQVVKEQLLFTTLSACLDVKLAVGGLQSASATIQETAEAAVPTTLPERAAGAPPWEPAAIRLEQALFRGQPEAARTVLPLFVEPFQDEPLLFAPLGEGGQPRQILRVRLAQTVLRALLSNLPRLGLLRETYELLRTARAMERAHPLRGRGVTEFNHFFQAAYQAIVESVVVSSATWSEEERADARLVEILERLTAPFLTLWIDHSRTLQLSVLETVNSEANWRRLQQFVQTYGGDLFHARFMTLGNLRGILHRGVSAYLDDLQANPDPLHPIRLLEDLDRKVRRVDAVRWLEVVLQAVVENYEEYKDYNTTTTQSDYGENLYVLLEFLRLKASYERHAWQLRPLVMAHEVLARHGRTAAAVLWEESLARFSRDLARQHLDQLTLLERARGIRLGTIADRLNEQFLKPLALDRLCALVEASMVDNQRGTEPADVAAFGQLQTDIQAFTASPVGVGLDVPQWLRRLEMEVHRVHAAQTSIAVLAENFFRIPGRTLSHDEVQRQLGDWERPALPQ
jgi:hypothetical protein